MEYQLLLMRLQVRSPLAPLKKGGTNEGVNALLFKRGTNRGFNAPLFKGGTNRGFKVPLFKGDLGGSSECCIVL